MFPLPLKKQSNKNQPMDELCSLWQWNPCLITLLALNFLFTYRQRWARVTFLKVRNCNFATWRKYYRNRNSATFKEMLLRNRNSAIAIFSEVHNLRASIPLFSAYFWPRNPVNSWEKIGGKKFCTTVPLRQVLGFQRNRGVRDGHGGGWSRKINAWHLYTLMVYL